MAASDERIEPVPPYTVEPLLFPTLPEDEALDASNPESPEVIQRNSQRAIRCAESDGSHLYIGSSDGHIHSYQLVIPSQSTSTAKPKYRLRSSRLISSNAKPVEKIVLLRPFQAAAVLSEGVLSFYSVPAWNPIRSLPVTRAVSTVVLDDEEVEHGDGTDGAGTISLCIVRRKNIILSKVGPANGLVQPLDRGQGELLWATIKEIPLPGGAIFARRFADTLCIANATEYSLVNLSSGLITQLHLPISQTGESPSAQVRPSIVTVPVPEPSSSTDGNQSPVSQRASSPSRSTKQNCEFLVTSHTGTITLGVFVKPSGEPAPKLLEWPSHPRSVCYDGKYLVSLLRNDTIEVHRIGADAVERVQTQLLPPGLEPRFLQSMPASKRPQQSDLISFAHHPFDILKVSLDEGSSEPQVLRRHIDAPDHSSCLQVLLCGRNATSLIGQEELMEWTTNHIDHGRLATLMQDLASLRREPPPKVSNNSQPPTSFHVAHAALAIELIQRIRFVDASAVLQYSMLDPRLVLGLFADSLELLPGSLASSTRNEAVIPATIAARLQKLQTSTGRLKSIAELIENNLVMNYSPPLTVESDSILRELRQKLHAQARHMLRTSLQQWREASAAFHKGAPSRYEWPGLWMDDYMISNTDQRVDTAYLDLLVSSQDEERRSSPHHDLKAFLASRIACDPEVVENILMKKQFFGLLAQHYERRGQTDKVLELWTGLVDGSIVDVSGIQDDDAATVGRVAAILEKEEDSGLLSKYGTWLVKKDPDAGVRILTRNMVNTTSSIHGKDAARTNATKTQELEAIKSQKETLKELQSIDSKAATNYLETVALSTSKVQDEQLHRELASALLARVRHFLSTADYRERMEAIAKDYSNGSYAESFFAHLALAATADSKDVERLKLTMLLQGSTVLDYDALLSEIERVDVLIYERAIVLGKLRRDKEALALLAVTLRDANSAEAYCSQDGEVLSPMLASSVAQDHPALQPFAAMLNRTHAQRVRAHYKATGEYNLSGHERKEYLLKQLLSVYMENGAEQSFQIATAHLLNTQALHLDSREVLELVPKDWPIKTLETFLTQSLRRQLHRKREAQIVRSISLCRSLDVAEDLWAQQRAMGGIIQDAEDDFAGFPDGDGSEQPDQVEADGISIVEEKKFGFSHPRTHEGNLEVHDITVSKEANMEADANNGARALDHRAHDPDGLS